MLSSITLTPSFLFVVVLLSSPCQPAAVGPKFGDCVPKTCGQGEGPYITFPFWINGSHPPSCGHYLFPVNCEDVQPVINFGGENYTVHVIDYEKKTFNLSPRQISRCKCSSFPSANLTLQGPFFQPSDGWLYIFSNCTNWKKQLRGGQEVSCEMATGEVMRYYVGTELVTGSCGPVVMYPAPTGWEDNRTKLGAFQLNWIGLDCRDCENSGGECGYNATKSGPMCICRDRIHPNDCDDNGSDSFRTTTLRIVVVVCVAIGSIMIGGSGYLLCKKTNKKKAMMRMQRSAVESRNKYHEVVGNMETEMELPLFELNTVVKATNNFAQENKLGEGGFGPVYKGRLDEGQDVAIKRLGRHSVQGIEEFKNEVILIAKLQHRNLVRLLGCCIEDEERMLIYEYMPGGSLDALLFDRRQSNKLDWKSRYEIIIGIARGLLYLHEDSRFRIIHRDIKAANVLLDAEMDPKISDFGLARIFRDEVEVNTGRVVGTYGYMSPEYVMDGIFSVKSDVFSFGVLVLEIISGKRNRGTIFSEPLHNLVGHTWSFWNKGRSLEIVDESIQPPFSTFQVMKCIKLGLLCVQEQPEHRPLMSTVVSILGSDNVSLPQPHRPGFAMVRDSMEMNSTFRSQMLPSSNKVTITTMDGR